MGDLRGRVALVTGSSSGIGAAIATALAGSGYGSPVGQLCMPIEPTCMPIEPTRDCDCSGEEVRSGHLAQLPVPSVEPVARTVWRRDLILRFTAGMARR